MVRLIVGAITGIVFEISVWQGGDTLDNAGKVLDTLTGYVTDQENVITELNAEIDQANSDAEILNAKINDAINNLPKGISDKLKEELGITE